MKRFICVVMILCLLFTLTACIPTAVPVKLDAPTNVKVSRSGQITWDAVANATGYVVEINGQQYSTTETTFQAPNATSSFNFTVKATAEGFEDSDATESSFTYVPSIIVTPPTENVTLAIVGASDVRSNQSITLKARIDGVATSAVTWEVTEGVEYIESINDGVLKAKEVDSDHIIKVKAVSTEHENVSAEKVLTVVAKTPLTQAMLDVFNGKNKVSFEGYLNIALYKPGATGNVLQGNYVNTIQTAMDGENWYAMYDSTGTGISQGMYVKKKDGLAQQVQVSLMNDEEYIPIKDGNGQNLTWEKSGMYNSFMGLNVNDFYFNEDTWQWTYRWVQTTSLVNRVVASANPYEFDPVNLTLIIEDGEIMGIHSKSAESRKVIQGYIAEMDLYVAINYTDTVEIPTISKYQRDEEFHNDLEIAINNMRNLTSYKVDFVKSARMFGVPSAVQDGFEEIVTENECFFRSYDLAVQDGEVVHKYTSEGYGFRKINDNFYNSYAYADNAYHASRAFNGDFANAKASFMFAPELFRTRITDEETGEAIYVVDEIMCQVATTWYCAPGTDMALYGLFATNYLASIYQYEPYVTVKDGYITEVGFFFNMSEMYGNVIITFSDFNTAKLDDDHLDNVQFETRQIPSLWSQLDIEVSKQDGSTEEETTVNAATYLDEKFGSSELVPFFGSVLGDTYGFGMTTMYLPSGGSRMYSGVMFYYDVPVDLNYTLDTSMNAIKDLLIQNGFTSNAAGEYHKGNLWIAPTDDGLDLKIYVWQV